MVKTVGKFKKTQSFSPRRGEGRKVLQSALKEKNAKVCFADGKTLRTLRFFAILCVLGAFAVKKSRFVFDRHHYIQDHPIGASSLNG